MSGSFNQVGAPNQYQFINQNDVTNALASGGNIDWAELAQQWIKMRDNAATTANIEANIPPNECDKNVFNIKYEEGGEADMEMDEEEQVDNKDRRESTTSITQQNPAAWKHPIIVQEVGKSAQRSQWSQWSNNTPPQPPPSRLNPTAHIPSLLKMNVPHPNEIRALPDVNNSSLMDAAKRKGLPAWIREGLEKMEKEKQKQQEKDTTITQGDVFDDDIPMSSSKARENDQGCTENIVPIKETDENRHDVNVELSDEEISGIDGDSKNYEHKLASLMVVVRHTLTELLLEITNEEISKIANETVKCYKLKASSAQVIQDSALSSITGKLGLAAYGDSSSDEDSDDGDDNEENNFRKKNILSESGNDSEEEIKNAIRLKRRSFVKIANEIEERVSAAAAREEEKLKQFFRKDETEANTKKCKRSEKEFSSDSREMVTNESVSAQLSSACSDKNIGKIYERDSGETTETKLQIINGKRQKDRGTLKKRITRFSDNRDNRYLAIATTSSCITNTQAKGIRTTIPQSITNQNQVAYNINPLLPSYNYLGIGASTCSENEVENSERENAYKRTRQDHGETKVSPSRSLSRSTSTSSSSSSTTSESSTSGSSDSSKYSHRSASKHTSQISRQQSRKHGSKYDDRKYYSSYNKKSHRESSYNRYSRHGRSRSRSRSSHRRHSSYDSDDAHNRRKHSRNHNSSKPHRDFSRSTSRSSYSSSSKRRH